AVAAAALVAVLLGVNGITTALNNGNGLPEALQLAHINAQPDAQRETVKLTNVNDDQRVVATLVWSGELGKSVLIVDGLATLTEDQTYELWYIGEDGPVSAGTFNTTGSGDSWRVLDGAMAAGDAVGVTIEPEGGSEQPTSDPLIVVRT
ncbi:MAG: anti-sigma factor, partial [Mycetocola sp.]